MKKILLLGLITSLTYICLYSCSQEEDIFGSEELSMSYDVQTRNVDSEEEDYALTFWAESLFFPENQERVMITRFETDGETGLQTITTRYEAVGELASPRVITRSETAIDSSWKYWGIISGPTSAYRFNNAMKKLYGNNCFESRFEPIEGSSDRKVYHRPCQN